MRRRVPDHIQLARCRAAIAYADRTKTPEELAAAELALAEPPASPQQSLFSAPPNVGLITDGQPEPTGLADRSNVGE